MNRTLIYGALLGIGVLFLLKYGVFGLQKWDNTFHPTRTDDSTSKFYKPFFGVGSSGGCNGGCS